MLVTDGSSGEAVYYEDAAIDFATVDFRSSPKFGLALSGTVYDSVLGSYSVAATEPMVDLETFEPAGFLTAQGGGGIRLESGGPVVELRAVSFAFAALLIDSDRDAEPEEALRLSWGELAGLTEPKNSVSPGPIANAGNMLFGVIGQPVTIHGLFSHDDDRDWLTFDWSVIARPLSSQVDVAEPALPVMNFVPDADGDYLFNLRVSDGTDVRQSSVLVRVAAFSLTPNPSPVSTTHAGLEIAMPLSSLIAELNFTVGAPVSDLVYEVVTDTAASAVTPVDINDDGSLDLVVRTGGAGASGVRILTATAGGFDAGLEMNGGQGEVATGDLNGDGLIDIAVSDTDGVNVLLQLPSGSFADPVSYANPTAGCFGSPLDRDIGIGDIDGDARDDLVSVNACDETVIVRLQDSSGNLGAAVVQSFSDRVRFAAFGDLNADGRLDAVLGVFDEGNVPSAAVIALGQPDGTLQEVQRISSDLVFGASVSDVDDDSDADIVLCRGSRDLHVGVR